MDTNDFSFEEEFESETHDIYGSDWDVDPRFMELKEKIKIYLEIAALTELVEEDLWDNFTEMENFILTQDEEELEEGDEDAVLNTLTEFLLPFYSGE